MSSWFLFCKFSQTWFPLAPLWFSHFLLHTLFQYPATGSFYRQLSPLPPKQPHFPQRSDSCHSPTHHFHWPSLACKEETQSLCPTPICPQCPILFSDKLPGSLILAEQVCPLNLFRAFLQYDGYYVSCSWQLTMCILFVEYCISGRPRENA